MSDERQDPVTEPEDERPLADSPSPGAEFPEARKRGTRTGPPPSRGGRRGRATRPSDPTRPCMNCGDPTPGEYCPTCGQRKVDVKVSVRVLMLDVLEDQFILDRRLPRTLGALLFRPGRLTVEYVNGRMASYIHPFRLYLVSSLLFFLLLSFLSLRLVRQASLDGGEAEARAMETVAEDSARLAELGTELAEVEAQLADSTLPAAAIAGLELGRTAILQNQARLQARLDSARAMAASADAEAGAEADAEPAVESRAPPGAEAAAAPDTAGGAPAPGGGAVEGPTTVSELFGWDRPGNDITATTGIAAVDSALEARIERIGAMAPRQALEEVLGTFLNYVPTLMFLLLPIFALVLKLLYLRRGRYYAEHFVFLLHVHSFVFVLATLMLLVRKYVAGWLELLLVGWILVYIFLALRRVYGQGRLKTFVKYWILGWMYFWILTMSLPFAVVAAILLF